MLLFLNSQKNRNKNNLKSNKEIISKNKIGIAFMFKEKILNGIEKMLFVLANKLVKSDKYDIYLITNKDIDFKCDTKIKLIKMLQDKNKLSNFDKNTNIKYYILNNDLSQKSIQWYQLLNGGKRVIGIMNRTFLSYTYTNYKEVYRNWKNTFLYDAFINLIPDEYFIYNNLGMTNTFYLPYLNNFNETKQLIQI